MNEVDDPSDWVLRFAPLIRRGGVVLDVACGGGRHLRALRGLGHPVVGVDRDLSGVGDLRGEARVELIEADLETGGRFPLAERSFAGIVVTRYLHRPLFPDLVAALDARGGVLIYETFMVGHERLGRPRNPDFLLRPGELLDRLRPPLEVVAYEAGPVEGGTPAIVQRICARRARNGPC